MPRYPVYIVSKGRWNNPLTHRALHRMRIPHYVIVESHEKTQYEHALASTATVIVLPQAYLDDYDTCDDLGFQKSKGPGAARNFAMDHAAQHGFTRHWVMDDNIVDFHYMNRNEKFPVHGTFPIRAMEDFVDRYENVVLAGPNYHGFAKKTDNVPAFIKNTRIYSCLLIDNTAGFRWRGRYNEDTDLSLRVLKAGFCTIQFNAFLAEKVTTQRMKGGNNDDFYSKEGTYPKSKMLEDLHPDVAKVVWKFNRWHHTVNYREFQSTPLRKKSEVVYSTYPIRTIPYTKELHATASPL